MILMAFQSSPIRSLPLEAVVVGMAAIVRCAGRRGKRGDRELAKLDGVHRL